jgi:hypothetical protein
MTLLSVVDRATKGLGGPTSPALSCVGGVKVC